MKKKLWVMVREHVRWLSVDFINFAENRGVPIKSLSRTKMEAVFEDGVLFLGFTEEQEKHGHLRGLDIAKRV